MLAAETKTYEDYLQEAQNITKEQLREMTADWRVPNSDEPLDFKKLGNPSEADIRYFGGV
jgi:hypothetical protein